MQGETFPAEVQPVLTLRKASCPEGDNSAECILTGTSGVKVYAHCGSAGCRLDCGNTINVEGNHSLCFAESGADGFVRFTDLALLEEDAGISHRLDFTFDDSPCQLTQDACDFSGIEMYLALGLSLKDISGCESGGQRGPLCWQEAPFFNGKIFTAGEVADGIEIGMWDGSNTLLVASRQQYYASILPADPAAVSHPPAEMANAPPIEQAAYAELEPTTCCQFDNCNQENAPGVRYCDCSDKRSTMCQIPSNGRVKFRFTFLRAGVFQVRVSVRTSKTFEYVEPVNLTVISNTVERLRLSTQPANSSKGTLSGDELALIAPAPKAYFADSFGNPGRLPDTAGAQHAIMALLCFDRKYSKSTEEPEPIGSSTFCSCDNIDPCRGNIGVSTPAISGGVKLLVNMSGSVTSVQTVRFTQLYTAVARSNLRLSFWYEQFGSIIQNFTVLSDLFSISPGRLKTLEVVSDPSTANCSRCPAGVHIAGENILTSVRLYDEHHNVIASCRPGNADARPYSFCSQHVNSNIMAVLGSNISTSRLLGEVNVNAADGLAVFDNLKVNKAGSGYYFRFITPLKDFTTNPRGITKDNIVVQTNSFTVIAGQPQSIAAIKELLIAADAEPFMIQPHIHFLDAYDNLVVQQCYTDCAGTLKEKCSLHNTPCADHSQVRVEVESGTINQPTFTGHKLASATNGLAKFTDLSLDLFGNDKSHTDSNCVCSESSCPTCNSCYSTPNRPLENVTLAFSATIDGRVLRTSQEVSIERRAQSLSIETQPTANGVQIAANDKFGQSVVIAARDCDGNIVMNGVATCTISVKDFEASEDDGTSADLSGVLTVPLTKGKCFFTSLQVNQAGTYTLKISYDGNARVLDKPTESFTVSRPASELVLLTTSLAGSSTVAGFKFEYQPKLVLRDKDGEQVTGSSREVTASILIDKGAGVSHLAGTAFRPTVLHGEVVVKANKGEVMFDDLMIQTAAQGYTLRFGASTFFAETGAFHVIPNDWAGLFVPISEQPLTSSAGSPLSRQPQVLLVDQFLNQILPWQVPSGTVVSASVVERIERQKGNPVTLLRHNCSEVCSLPPLPIVCRTCTDLSLNASRGSVRYTDLRIDIAYTAYHLRFNASYNSSVSFFVDSNAFSITPSDGAGLILNSFEGAFFADRSMTQPEVNLTDKYGNVMNDVSKLQDGIVRVRLVTLAGKLPVAPPSPPVPGQIAGSVCTVFPNPLQGNSEANISTGIARFSDLSVRQAMTSYRLEFEVQTTVGPMIRRSNFFDVIPGVPVRLCNMSLPSRCEQKSPCLDPAEIACADAYGNVQRDCQACTDKMQKAKLCSYRYSFGLDTSPCAIGKICARLVTPLVANVSSQHMCSGQPCAHIQTGPTSFVPAYVSAGMTTVPVGALFDSLTFSFPSADFELEFYTYLHHPTNKSQRIELLYSTPLFQVKPPRPSIKSVTFSGSFVELTVEFDRATDNCPKSLGETEPCVSYLDPVFISALGTPARCGWTDSKTLMIHLGTGATVNSSTPVLLARGNTITHTARYNGYILTSLPATTKVGVIVAGQNLSVVRPQLPSSTPVPQPVITGVGSIGACERVELDSRSSSGNAGRPFFPPDGRIEWGVDYDNSYIADGILSSTGAPIFINRYINFSTLLPGKTNRVTVKIRPNAAIIQGSIITIHGLPGHVRRASGCAAPGQEVNAPPPYVPCFSKFDTKQHMQSKSQPSSYHESRCIDVPLSGPGSKYFEVNGSLYLGPGKPTEGVPVAQWYYGASTSQNLDNNVELHLRVLGMRADREGQTCGENCPNECKQAHCCHCPSAAGTACKCACNCASFIPAGEVTTFEFEIVNPYRSTDARELAISVNCDPAYDACSEEYQMDSVSRFPQGPLNWKKTENVMHTNCRWKGEEVQLDTCARTIQFGSGDFSIDVVKGNISETTSVKGARNTITVTVIPSVEMPAGSKIILKGLVGSTTKSGSLCVQDVRDLGTNVQAGVFDCESCSPHKESAQWTADTGAYELTIKNGSELSAAGIAFSFDLNNADGINRLTRPQCLNPPLECPSQASPLIALQAPGNVGRAAKFVKLEGDVLGSGRAPALMASVVEGNSLQGRENVLWFQFSANTDLKGGAVVTFWTDSQAGLGRALVSQTVQAIDVTGCWTLTWLQNQTSSMCDMQKQYCPVRAVQARLASTCTVLANQAHNFGIKIFNHHSEVSSPRIYANATYAGCKACVETCGCQKLDSAMVVLPDTPVQGSVLRSNTLPGFDDVMIKEESTVPNQRNKISIVFKSNFDAAVPDDQFVTAANFSTGLFTNSNHTNRTKQQSSTSILHPWIFVAGLDNVQMDDASNVSVNVTVGTADRMVSFGSFDSLSGELRFLFPGPLPSRIPITCSFMLYNGAISRPTPKISLRGTASAALCGNAARTYCDNAGLKGVRSLDASNSGLVTIKQVIANGAVLGYDGTPQIVTKSIKELSQVSNAFNIITVHLRTNFRIRHPASISLSNLIGTKWPKENADVSITVVSTLPDLLPNCSCSDCEDTTGSEPCACTSSKVENLEDGFFLWQHSNLFRLSENSLVKGQWNYGLLVLDLAAGQDLEAGSDIVFSFAVQNSAVAQDVGGVAGRIINVTLKTSDLQITEEMDGRILGSGGKPIFSLFQVKESSTVTGEFTEIFVSVQSNFPMVSLGFETQSVLKLSGFQGYRTPWGFMPIFGKDAFRVSKSGFANWTVDEETGSATLLLKGGVMIGGCGSVGGPDKCALKVPGILDETSLATSQFSFILQNSNTLSGGGSIPRLEYSSSEVNAVWLGGGSVIGVTRKRPEFVYRQLTETNIFQRCQNVISLEVELNTMLTANSKLNVSGFKASLSDSGEILLGGPNGSLFTGTFDNPAGTLILQVKREIPESVSRTEIPGIGQMSNIANKIPANARLNVTFTLLNPMQRQDSQKFSIGATLESPSTNIPGRPKCKESTILVFGSRLDVPAIPMDEANVFQAQESLRFTTKLIGESTKVNWGINTIKITLISPSILPPETLVTLTGFETPIPNVGKASSIGDSATVGFPLAGPATDFFMMEKTFSKQCPDAELAACNDDNPDTACNCVPSAVWESGGKRLTLTVKRAIPAQKSVELAFKFRNMGCSGVCPGKTITIAASGKSGDSGWERFVVFAEQPMEGRVMGAGVQYVSWIKKTVKQDHTVPSASNRLTFSFRPNTPLYPGTTIIIDGIVGSPSDDCKKCVPPQSIHGLGCDDDCDACTPKALPGAEDKRYRPCIPVYQAGTFPLVKTDKFELISTQFNSQSQPENSNFAGKENNFAASLTLTVRERVIISETSDTEIVIVLQNNVKPGPWTVPTVVATGSLNIMADASRADCVPPDPRADKKSFLWGKKKEAWDQSKCLTIRIGSLKLCDSENEFLPGERCEKPASQPGQVQDPALMSTSSPALDSFGNFIVDQNPLIVRHSDLYQLQGALEGVHQLLLKTKVQVPSLAGVPTLRSGVVAAGHYRIYLVLTNWLGNAKREFFEFRKDHPGPGQGKGALGDENPKPRIYIDGVASRQMPRNQQLQLKAVGTPIECFPQQSQGLTFEWSMSCAQGDFGYCKIGDACQGEGNCNINKIVNWALSADLLIPKNQLVPGAEYTFVCVLKQGIGTPVQNQASVKVNVVIQPLVISIQGASPGGFEKHDQTLELTAVNSYDPEKDMTQQTSEHFVYVWSCHELRTKCTSSLALCPPNDFVPCGGSWRLIDSSSSHTIRTNATYMRPDWIYRITVNVTRSRDALLRGVDRTRMSVTDPSVFAYLPPREIVDEEQVYVPQWEDLIVDGRWLGATHSTIEFQTLGGNSERVVVSVMSCDPAQLSTGNLCQRPIKVVDPGSKVVLKAEGKSISGGVITGYEWKLKDTSPPENSCPSPNILTSDILDSTLESSLLLIRPNVLAPGLTTTFVVRLKDSNGFVGEAMIDVIVNHPPRGGRLQVVPDNGMSLNTIFRFEALFWDPFREDNLPLRYDFFVFPSDDPDSILSLGAGPVMSLSTSLPAGDPKANYTLKTGVSVSDALGTEVQTVVPVSVRPPDLGDITQSLKVVDGLIQAMDLVAAQSLVGVIAQTLNAQDACGDDYQAECSQGLCCERRQDKYELLLKLMQAGSLMVPSASKIIAEMNVLQLITAKPTELSYEAVKKSSLFLENRFDELRQKGIGEAVKNSEKLARSCTRVLENIVLSAAQSVANKVVVPYTLNEHPGGIKDDLSSNLRKHSKKNALRSAITFADAQTTFQRFVRLISEVSSLSVRQAVAGQRAISINTTSFVVNTSVVKIRGEGSLVGDFQARTQLGVSADIPAGVFSIENLPASLHEMTEVEIMHSCFHPQYNPIPGAKGPTCILEARKSRESTPIPFVYPLKKPFEIQLPYSSLSRQCSGNNSTNCLRQPPESSGRPHVLRRGYTLTAFGKIFDFETWRWSPEGLTRKSVEDCEASGETCAPWVKMTVRKFGVFASSEVWAGCDNVPRSGAFQDDCGVCAVWPSTNDQSLLRDRTKVANATCSGCDGEPNTGRLKTCSGHGTCSYAFNIDRLTGQDRFEASQSRCNCNNTYFGPMCDVICLEASKCSGHGLCSLNAGEEGKKCLCNKGYTTSDPKSGIFCDKGSGSLTVEKDPNEGKLSREVVRSLLIYGIPGFVGFVVLCLVLYYAVSYRRRQRKTIRETVIEFPQPQLEIPAENRADSNFMLPDENGWTNNELPKASATLSYGPESGQLASAVASSNRATLGKINMERIGRRAHNMRRQVKKRSTVNKYKIEGPVHWEGDEDDDEDDDTYESSNEDSPGHGSEWFITQSPEWLSVGNVQEADHDTGTPSDEEEAIV